MSVSLDANASPVYCYNVSFCCGRWNVDADRWWIHHPHWVVALEDPKVGFCWTPTQDHDKQDFLRQLHQLQWGVDITDHVAVAVAVAGQELEATTTSESFSSLSSWKNHSTEGVTNCSNLVTTVPISSGYGASLRFLFSSFWYAYTHQRPFQIIQRGPWMYAMAGNFDNHTWADCPDHDVSCLYLPISPCSRYNQTPQPKMEQRPDPNKIVQVMQWLWCVST